MYTFLILSVVFQAATGQSLLFDKSFDFSYYDRFNDLVEVENNGYLLVGETRVPNDIQNILLVKTNENGELLWSKTFGGNLANNGSRIISSQDGNFYIGGRYVNQAYVLKVNADGDSLTSSIFESEYGSQCMDLAELQNGNLLLLQQIFLLPTSTDIILSDPQGNPIWTADATANEASTIHLGNDDTFYVTGFNGMVMYPHAIVASYDMQGNLLFSHEYSEIEGVFFSSVLSPQQDIYLGGYHFFGYHSSPSILKTDVQGVFDWEEAYFDNTTGGIQSLACYGDDFLISEYS
jgi:hypothetical protein